MKENLSTNILSCAIILVYYFGIRSKSVLAYGWHTVGIRSKSVLAYGWHTVQIRSGIRLAYGWHTSTTLLLRLGIRSNSCLAYGRHTVAYGLGVFLVYGRVAPLQDKSFFSWLKFQRFAVWLFIFGFTRIFRISIFKIKVCRN